MNATTIHATLEQYAAGTLSGTELVARVRAWCAALPNGVDDLRRNWPVDRLPIIGPYVCVAPLGEGASGVVYRAAPLTGEADVVALKLLRLIADDDKRRFFEREVEILKSLRCPHVARYLDSGTFHGTSYLSMELVHGIPLDLYLTEHAPTLDDKLALFEKVALTVAELHAAGVIHRDLKPRHIIVDAASVPRIVDLGLSAVRTEDWATQVRRTQTRLGRIIGTLKYMSPEQAWGGLYQTDYRADIWALGVMLFEIATDGGYPYSQEPIEGMSPADSLLYRIQNETPARPNIVDPRHAAALSTLIARCLAHEPRRRLDSAADLATDLARIRARQRISTRPLPVTYRLQRIAIGLALHARPALWSMSILGTVILIFAAVFLFNVHWVTRADAYSAATQQRLIMAAHPRGEIDILIAGIGDETLAAVPEFAASHGLPGVTADVRTWRGVHGQLMERMTQAKPRLLLWDIFFRTRQPQDPEFVAGVRALDEAGTPVCVAIGELLADGGPAISPDILGPLGETLHRGMALARDMVLVPGEYVIALQRKDRVYPALIVAAFSALCYPDCQPEIHWPQRRSDLQLRYRRRGEANFIAPLDDIEVHSRQRVLLDARVEKKDDLLAYAAFPLVELEYWRERTIPYEQLVRATPQELGSLVDGRIVLVVDTRSPSFLLPRDLHSVRFESGVVHHVPGGYLVANGILGMIQNRHKVFHLTLLGQSFGLIVGMAGVACLLAVLVGRRLFGPTQDSRKIAPAAALLAAAAGACLWSMATANSAVWVQVSIACASLFATLIPALAIERTRHQRHVTANE